jgi:hypothetical protein
MENISLDKLSKPDELDYNMILSVPEEIGLLLQRIIQGQATAEEKNNTKLQIIENTNDRMDLEESRKLIFKVGDTMLPITILDLPSIIEAKKTIDYKTFYKSSDISQMMFVHDKEFKLNNEEDIEQFNPFKSKDHIFRKITWKKDPDHRYKLKHGLAKCSKNIRARRFKAKHRYNHEEMMEVCKKLKSIIDNGAANFENQVKKEKSVNNIDGGDGKTMENQSVVYSADQHATEIKVPKSVKKKSNKTVSAAHANGFSAPQNKASKFNINLSLTEPVNPIPLVNNNNIISLSTISLPTESIIDPDIEEYMQLKEEYKRLKGELESDPTNEAKKKLKKKIKKRLKQIKENKK